VIARVLESGKSGAYLFGAPDQEVSLREFGKFVPIGSAHRVTAFVRCERVSNAVSITGSWGSSQRIRKEVTH
jgi:hypothetical protein